MAGSLCFNSLNNSLVIKKFDEKMNKTIKQIFSKSKKIADALLSEKNYKYFFKQDNTVVSSVDLLLQEEVIKIIIVYYPKHNILFEEGDNKHIDNGSLYTWVIDPIDGTSNFINGKIEFSVSIGLMLKNKFIAAMVYFPKISECYIAVKNDGVYLNNELIKIDRIRESTPKVIILCSKTYKQNKKQFEENGYKVEYYYCATFSMLKVLKNEAILFCTVNTQIYDVGPMSYILEQSGIDSYDRSVKKISYNPNLNTIGYIVSSNDKNTTFEFNEKLILIKDES